MKQQLDWSKVWERLGELASYPSLWRADQDRSLAWIRRQLQEQPGVLVADEVGLGKTRLAIALAVCVAACNGRIAILIPPGLTFQWRDEELRPFLDQLIALGLDWVPKDVTSKMLRTYPDLFDAGQQAPVYPLSAQMQFLFVSHRFGLPQRLPSITKDELWGLPFVLKKKLVDDGRKVRGAGRLDLPKAQLAAVDWLARKAPISLRRRVMDGPLSSVNTAAYDDPQAQTLFRNIIGELIGDVDLLILDEAHKNRAGAGPLAAKEKAAQTIMQSRLSLCMNEIIMRPGSASRQAKRLALTATPMELEAKQWADILHRLGLAPVVVDRLTKAVQQFSDAVQSVELGSEKELATLASASTAFQAALEPVVTRRVWRDHPTVKRFAANVKNPDAAHPHRRMQETTIALDELPPTERLRLACAESLAVASRGIEAAWVHKHAGSQHSQALPLISESPAEQSDKEGPKEVPVLAAGEQAKLQRQSFWSNTLRKLTEDMGAVAKEPRWSLQWHPKVHRAIRLIEELAAGNEKVLVFAEFLDPMAALDRALNIRHYLRQVHDGQPLPLPAGLTLDDPDLLRWLGSEEMGFSPEKIASFADDAVALGTRYANDRSTLRDVCQHAAQSFLDKDRRGQPPLDTALMSGLVTWLVQHVCVHDQLALLSQEEGRPRVAALVDDLLNELKDADPAQSGAGAESDAECSFDWARVIREHEKELEKDQSGHHVFRMSPFSQRLYGETRPSTRRVRQSTFNNAQLNPRVLIAQSAVASEGLNLHRACRTVVMFHLDWNPGRIEQQIGRVDRQDSAWMNDFDQWECDGSNGEPPHIDVHTIVLEGTYDAFRTRVVAERAKILRSQLFGEMLSAEQLQRLPEHLRDAVRHIKIDFRPPASYIQGSKT